MEVGARSDKGRVRENNEDSFRLAPELNLFVLSDGMGGLESGERASRMATETVLTHCRDAQADPALAVFGTQIEGVGEASNRLASAMRLANQEIFHAAQDIGGRGGMGATIVAVRFLEDRACIAHVGDSRAYLFRDEQLNQLTEDHSFVAEQVRRGIITLEQAGRSRMQNVLTRALGVEQAVDVEVTEELLRESDTYLLCSDGLFRELSEPQIAGILQEATSAQQRRRFAGRAGQSRRRRRQHYRNRLAPCAEGIGRDEQDRPMVQSIRGSNLIGRAFPCPSWF